MTAWQATTEQLDARTTRLRWPLSYSNVLDLWEREASFRAYFTSLLAAFPHQAFRWETPAVTRATLDRPFECVVVDDPWLDRAADRKAFAAHFPRKNVPAVVSFANLGRDAVMVVPCPVAEPAAYVHLAAFVRHAPEEQQHELWRTVAHAMQARLSDQPVWLSTAGGGIAWLHVRLDDRPKYYTHAAYRKLPGP